jgi:hypothetical protein
MVFGIIFAMIYDSIPSKGIAKGVVFSLIFYFLISTIRPNSFSAAYGEIWWVKVGIWTGFFASVTYGLVLGLLYRKPTK